uniref:Uncharacterized protein n=1 Tax=Nelumbo nucifera TaxID=4432 RepID=A0A822Z144_NELNU|nr:TPA_asm: hypothetical protein HUJ06_013034 [Nelumbo nucifera]
MCSTSSILNATKRPSKKKRRANDSSYTSAMEKGSAKGRSIGRRSAECEVVIIEEEGRDPMYVNPSSYGIPDPTAQMVMPHVPTPNSIVDASSSHGSPFVPQWNVSTTNQMWDPRNALPVGGNPPS